VSDRQLQFLGPGMNSSGTPCELSADLLSGPSGGDQLTELFVVARRPGHPYVHCFVSPYSNFRG
jgi:hypothetical protein